MISQNIILDNLNTAILVFDETLKLNYINTAGEILLGDSAKHLFNKSTQALFKHADLEHDLQQLIMRNEGFVNRGLVLHLQHKNITLNLSATPIYEQHKAVNVLIELQEVDRHLRISKEEQLLAQQNTSQVLMRSFAHEIKNPLGGLRGAAQLLELELVTDELKEYTQIIIEEADRMKSLMDKMLGPNKVPNKVSLNIHEPLERVRQLVNAEVSQDIDIMCDYDPSIPNILADKNQLIQVFLNIIRNAAQAIATQGNIILRTRVERHMTIANNTYKLTARIDIIDDGIGIKEELIDRIFFPMITYKQEGTGLGLTIAQSIINQYGGLIECSSTGENTTFSIFLPITH